MCGPFLLSYAASWTRLASVQGRQGTPEQGDSLMVGIPARPLFFVILKNRFRIMYFSQYINIYAINGLVNQ